MRHTRNAPPFCLCDCGQRVCWNRGGKKRWNRFISGHNSRGISRPHTGETKAKLKAAWTPERKRKHIEFRTGMKWSDDSRKKLSKSCKGRPSPRKGCKLSDATKRKISEKHKGKKLSEEHKNKIRIGNARTLAEHPEIRDKLRTWKGRKHTRKHKKMIQLFMKNAWATSEFRNRLMGENAWNWHGGKSFEPYSPEFNKALKLFIFQRDDNICQNPGCKEFSKRKCPHHIDYDKKNCNPLNLITLCYSCNAKANFNRKAWKRFYQEIMSERHRYAT